MARSTFPLRLSDPALREGIREMAEHEHVSQNAYIEQAIRNDLVLRGELRARQLNAAVARLSALSAQAYAGVVERSLIGFAEAEAEPDPLRMTALHSAESTPPPRGSSTRPVTSVLDAVAALRRS